MRVNGSLILYAAIQLQLSIRSNTEIYTMKKPEPLHIINGSGLAAGYTLTTMSDAGVTIDRLA